MLRKLRLRQKNGFLIKKTCIFDAIGNTFYFGEIQEKALGQCSGHVVYISAPRIEDPTVFSGVFQKKQAAWLRKCLFKYSTEVRFVLEILEN